MSHQQSSTHVSEAPASTLRALARAFQILRVLALGQEQGMRLVDVVRHTQLSRPTVHRILQALLDENAVEQDLVTRRYRVGGEISMLALARPSRSPLRKLAEPHLQLLSDQLGDTVFITVRSGRDSVCLDRRLGTFPIKVMSIDIGTRRPLGVGVAGVILLCGLPDEETEYLLQMNEARLDACNLTIEEVKARLVAAKERGYAYTAHGVTKGTAALSVPIFGAADEIVGALSVAAISGNLTLEHVPATAAALMTQAALITSRIKALDHKGAYSPLG